MVPVDLAQQERICTFAGAATVQATDCAPANLDTDQRKMPPSEFYSTSTSRSAAIGKIQMHCPALAKRATVELLHLIAVALLQRILLEPAQAADAKPDECGLASVYSSLSEETASGEDTSAKNLTAAHRSLPFGTMVQVDNQENGRSAVVRITDRGPFVSGRIIDLSQIAAQKLGFSDLTQVCLKILTLPEIGPVDEN